MDSGLSRRQLLLVLGSAAAGPWTLGREQGEAAKLSIDFTREIGRTRPNRLGIGVTTYGHTALDNPALDAAERRLDARYVRIPIALRNGHVTTGAAGAPTTLDACALIRKYQERKVRVLAVLAGPTTDIDVQPGEVETIARKMADGGVDLNRLELSSPNEPNNQKLTLEQSIALAKRCCEELRSVHPGKRIWGPAWTWYDRGALRQFAQAMGDRLAGVDFHHYAMGVTSLSTAEAMSQIPKWGSEVGEVLQDLKTLGLPLEASVSELNLSWRYEDGTPPDGKNHRFFTAVNTVWCAGVLGHILQAGGSAAVYGNQNGALGVFSDDGAATPMPAFWGIAAWTGAGLFPHFADRFYEASNAGPTEAFAVSNERGGRNVVLINKSEADASIVDLEVRGFDAKRVEVFQSDTAKPTTPFHRAGTTLAGLTLPPMTVTIVVLHP